MVFLLPLAGVGALRLYDNELIRQTEAELISQVAFTEAAYLDRLRPELRRRGIAPETYGVAPTNWVPPVVSEDGQKRFRPSPVKLDLTEVEIVAEGEDPLPTEVVEPVAHDVGPQIYRVLRAAQEVTLSGIRVVDTNGTIVVSTRGESKLALKGPEVDRALTGEVVHMVRERTVDEPETSLDSLSRPYPIRVFIAAPIVNEGRVVGAVVASRTPVSLQKAVYDNRQTFSLYGLLLIALVLVISLLTTFAINAPIRALIRQARRVQSGESPEMIKRPVTAEFHELSHAMVEMATELEERREYVQAFARAVAHELKTPIASTLGAVELLVDHIDEMDVERRDRFLANIEKDTRRMDQLITRLHELARAEQPTEGEPCKIVAYINSWCPDDVELDVTIDETTVNMPEAVLDRILNNLVENARKYGEAPIHVLVREVRSHKKQLTQGVIAIDVWDSGDGISEGNAQKIFDAFFTTGRESGGTGLGLSISARLAESHGATLRLLDRTEARFRLELR